jgi:ABC-type transport system involved in multi-copper enzyme maturation permease subunit
MLGAGRRIAAIAFNTYREAVRARILLGLFALALATALYSIAVGEFALKNASRVVADLGAASISIYSIAVAIIIGATSLYRELEQKTLFPILARPLRRAEYLVGKYLGTLLTIAVFISHDAAAVLLILARHGGRDWTTIGVAVALLVGVPGLAFYHPRWRTYVPIPWAIVAFGVAIFLSSGAADARRVVLGAIALALMEVMIVSALATLFSSFSSPFLSAVFTIGVFIVGREAGTLARLPVRFFGEDIHRWGAALSTIVPNLEVYVPPRGLLTGEALHTSLARHLALSGAQALAWSVGLLVVSSMIFERRDLS